jgi:transcriptional regulator GlxA family with amidase domain
VRALRRRLRLQRARRLLIELSRPGIADLVARLGYNSREHALGWRAMAVASGLEVPFHYHLSEADRRLAYTELNLWYIEV